jgi:hypothetical protein
LPDYVGVPVDLLECKSFPVYNLKSRAQTLFYLTRDEEHWLMDTRPDPQATGLILRPNPLNQGLVERLPETVRSYYRICNQPEPPELVAACDRQGEERPPTARLTTEVPDLVTLDQAAAAHQPVTENRPPEGEHRHTKTHVDPPVTGPLSETIGKLKRSARKAELVRYLWNRPEREAELRLIALDVFNVRESSLHSRMKSVRKQVERTRDRLEQEECPLRLDISANSVRLVEVKMSP